MAQNGNGTNGKATASKAPTDYAAMLDEAEIRRDGLQLRTDRAERQMNELLGKHPEAEKIRQSLKRYALDYGRLQLAEAQVTRYMRLLASKMVTVSDQPPTTPPTDSEREAAASAAAKATAK